MTVQQQTPPNKASFIGGLVFFLLVLVLVFAAGWQFSRWVQGQQTAPIAEVKLYGQFVHLDAANLQQQLQQQFVGNFFRVDVDQVQQFLQQQPWVYQVAVRKQWPDTLVVVVTEQQPVAIWNAALLLNNKGELFDAPVAQLQQVLPLLHGPDGTEQDALSMFILMQQLLQLHQFSAEQLWLTERFSWRIQLTDGLSVQLGRQDTLKRLQRLIDLYPLLQQHKAAAMAEVDLRYDTGIAVRYAEPETKRKA